MGCVCPVRALKELQVGFLWSFPEPHLAKPDVRNPTSGCVGFILASPHWSPQLTPHSPPRCPPFSCPTSSLVTWCLSLTARPLTPPPKTLPLSDQLAFLLSSLLPPTGPQAPLVFRLGI